MKSLGLIFVCMIAFVGNYVIADDLAPREFYALLGLMGVAFLTGGIEWWEIRRDLRYRGVEEGISVRLADRPSRKTNTVFLAHERWLTFSRRYATWWQAILARFEKFESFFLDVTFEGDGEQLQIKVCRSGVSDSVLDAYAKNRRLSKRGLYRDGVTTRGATRL